MDALMSRQSATRAVCSPSPRLVSETPAVLTRLSIAGAWVLKLLLEVDEPLLLQAHGGGSGAAGTEPRRAPGSSSTLTPKSVASPPSPLS